VIHKVVAYLRSSATKLSVSYNIRKNMSNEIILIGGVHCLGKSSVALELSKKLNTNQISTDTIRLLLRTISDEKKYHSLHFFVGKKAVKYLPNTSIDQIIKDYIRESKSVWLGIKNIIKHNKYNKIGVIEGVAILPVLCKRSRLKNVLPIFLYCSKPEIIRNNLFKRGLWGNSKKLKEYELKYLIEFNNYIIKTARKYNYKVVDVYPYKTLQRRFLDAIRG